ncbi:MAG: hypothetical protein KAU50_02440 [Candidatus Marinimicrobia bacterium]|nr:hypothetical protein [Candidatus Neomarinimicrobiota bacterium]
MSSGGKKAPEDELREWYRYFMTQVKRLRKEDEGSLIEKYFVVREGKIIGHYDKFDTAYKASIEQFSDGRFIIQQLLPSDQAELILVTA